MTTHSPLAELADKLVHIPGSAQVFSHLEDFLAPPTPTLSEQLSVLPHCSPELFGLGDLAPLKSGGDIISVTISDTNEISHTCQEIVNSPSTIVIPNRNVQSRLFANMESQPFSQIPQGTECEVYHIQRNDSTGKIRIKIHIKGEYKGWISYKMDNGEQIIYVKEGYPSEIFDFND